MKNILVIEDWQPMAKAIKQLLESAGHKVTWLTGAISQERTKGGIILSGLTAAGKTQQVQLNQFQIAFVDGQLDGSAMQGAALVALLSQNGIACCGMSTLAEMNKNMLAMGATMACKKPIVMAGLLSARLQAEAVVSPSEALKSHLSFMEGRFTTPLFAALRAECDAFLTTFLGEGS